MKQNSWYCLILVVSLIILSGCSRYICWGKDIFNQGIDLNGYYNLVNRYIRHIRIYDQFTTLGLFDALWLDDPVRTAYARVYGCKRGLSKEYYNTFLRQQLQENKSFISFYILAAMPSYDGSVLGDKQSMWSVHLLIDGQRYQPIETKIVDLAPEYKRFFGKTFTKFKAPFLVTFNAKDIHNKYLIQSSTRSISLIFRRIGHQESMEWKIDWQGNIVYCDDCHPDLLAYDINDTI